MGPKTPSLNCRVFLLAAGKGTRMGEPKAWMDYQGRPLLEQQIDFLLKLFEPNSIAVSIQKPWLQRCLRIHQNIQWTGVDPEAAPLGALINLLRLGSHHRWAFLYHVDMPVWEPTIFQTLSERLAPALAAVIPTYQGQKGHPVLLSPGAQNQILNLNPNQDRLDWWLRSQPTAAIEIPYPGITQNWNFKSNTIKF